MTTVNPVPPKPSLPPPEATHVSSTLRTKLPFAGRLSALRPLAGDASNRRYFRLFLDEAPVASVILMQLAEPEAFKASEEAVSGTPVAIAELPFVNVLRHLATAGVAVPALYYYDQAAGLLYLQDFGDLTLAEACLGKPAPEITGLYHDAVDVLARLHRKATTPLDRNCLAFHRAFDVPLLMWEFDHFLEYGVVARQKKPMCADDLLPVRAEFAKIAELLASLPQVFTHRDYHSRNLMVREAEVNGSRLGVLDFQDALLGPASYDLASLLRDAYIALDESLVNELLQRYLNAMAGSPAIPADRQEFRRLFDLTSIQRNLKAAGRFVYIDRIKHNPKFLADIPRVLGYVRRNLAKYPELGTLRDHLTPYVPELA
jgi:aminoglycoside/choline kinase family phosphotransferase